MPDDFPMSAVSVIDRIFNDTGRYRVEMHVGYDLPQVITRIDDPCPISTLPEPPEISSPPIELPCNDGLKALHRTPQWNRARLHDEVVVVAHQAPGEHSPIVEVTYMSDGFHKLFRLIRIIKGKLAASNAALHVVGGSGNKEARLSRHGMPPMRGRDQSILLSRRHKSTMSQCEVWHP